MNVDSLFCFVLETKKHCCLHWTVSIASGQWDESLKIEEGKKEYGKILKSNSVLLSPYKETESTVWVKYCRQEKIVRVLPKGSHSRDLERCIQAVFVNKTQKGCEPAAWLFCQSTMSEKLFLRQIVNRSVTMIAWLSSRSVLQLLALSEDFWKLN